MFPSQLTTFLFLVIVILLTFPINNSNLSFEKGNSCLAHENINHPSPQMIYELNDIFQILYKYAQHEQYQHNEDFYQKAKNIVKVIKEATNFAFTQHDQVTLFLGKTGWGKSTDINILSGAKFRTTQDGLLQPIDEKQIKTLIGKGDGSTTMFPVCIDTRFGKICDLPGDEETRGIIPQLINAISKKKLGKSLKKIKLVLVVPASVFTAEGSYGSEFKKILASANKFLGGIDKYKNNMILLINFADRWQKQFQKVIDNINKTLKHQDGVLNQYKQLIVNLITDKKIKLIAKPSMESEQYNAPQIKGWEDHQIQKITQAIINLPIKISKQQDFSVPYNPNIIPKLKSFLKIFIQKAKNSIQASFTTLNISGLQLNYVKDFLKQIRNTKHLSLEQFITQYETNRYFDVKQVNQVMDEIKFIAQFLGKNQVETQLHKGDWISQNLQKAITQVIQNIYNVTSAVMLNFRKIAKFANLNVKANSQTFNHIENQVKQLQRLQIQLSQTQTQSNDQSSSFYQDQIIKIYDKTIQQPYQIEQQYIQYEIQQKLYRIPKQEQYQIDVKKERIKYRQQDQRYKQKVPYTKKVPRTQTTVTTTQGGRIYFGIFGPRETHKTTTTSTVQVDQVYFVDQQRTRKIQVPYTEYYTQKQKRIKVVQIEQLRQQQVAIQKKRTKTLYRQKQLYKNNTMRIFNTTKYQQKLIKITQQIQYTIIKIKQVIRNEKKAQLAYKPLLTTEDCKLDFQKNNVQIFYQWFVLQHHAFVNKYPYCQIIGTNKTEIHAD